MNKLQNDIVTILNTDARYSVKTIAEMVGESEETVASALKAMEDSGIIVKYIAVVNAEKADNELVDAFIEVRTVPEQGKGFDAIASEICRYKEVKDVYLMSGGYDLAVTIEAKTLREVSNFVHEKLALLDGVKSTSTHFILKYYKISGVTVNENKSENRLPVQA